MLPQTIMESWLVLPLGGGTSESVVLQQSGPVTTKGQVWSLVWDKLMFEGCAELAPPGHHGKPDLRSIRAGELIPRLASCRIQESELTLQELLSNPALEDMGDMVQPLASCVVS